MIEILDNDTPISAASKIIYGTKPVLNPSFADRIARDLFRRDGEKDTMLEDMFSNAELAEIGEYLITYAKIHRDD